MSKVSAEKRKHRRYIVRRDAELYAFSPDTPRFIGKGVITDISLGGLRFESNVEFEHDDVLVEFFLSGYKERFAVRCVKIRKSNEELRHIYGLKLHEVPFYDKVKLWAYLLSHKNI